MTPEAAVEAARMTFLLYADDEIVENDAKGNLSRAATREILEAAAPHFASAWHDAVSNAYVDGALSADQASVMYGANPYRTTK